MIPDWLSPYLPATARPVRENTNALPYISIDDLIVFKVDACGLREREASKRQEACVAAALLELASEHGPINVDEDKLDRIEQALPEILEFCDAEHDKSWWQRRLGGVPDKRRSVQRSSLISLSIRRRHQPCRLLLLLPGPPLQEVVDVLHHVAHLLLHELHLKPVDLFLDDIHHHPG
uniref:Uncharacterized protein n=1 Tax=Bionectria ochroleuca TaxID=29856 RepID=A0A8H7N3Y5_BIOOC